MEKNYDELKTYLENDPFPEFEKYLEELLEQIATSSLDCVAIWHENQNAIISLEKNGQKLTMDLTKFKDAEFHEFEVWKNLYTEEPGMIVTNIWNVAKWGFVDLSEEINANIM